MNEHLEKEQSWAYRVPEVINDNRVPQSAEEAAYLALVRLCHERGEWYPEASYAQCMGYTDHPVRQPTERHPVLEDQKYHRYGQTDEPLNLRGRKKLAWMIHRYEKTIDDYWEITLAG